MIDTFGIPLAFIIIAALTLWVVIGSRGWWWLKAIVVALAVLFSISLWQSLKTLEGWPTEEQLPAKFEIKWITVEEPNKKTGDKGSIYIWAKNLQPKIKKLENGLPILHKKGEKNEPRLHVLPYNRAMHKQAGNIQKQIAKGKPFYGEIKKGKLKGQGNGKKGGKGGKGKGGKMKGQGKNSGRTGNGFDLSNEQDPIFHELPPPVLPEKITN